MYIKPLSLAFACLFTFVSFAQQKNTFNLGSELLIPKKSETLLFTSNNENGVVHLSLKKDMLHVSQIDGQTLKTNNEKEIILNDAIQKMELENIITLGHQYFWLTRDWDKKSKTENLYATEIDIKKGGLITNNQPIIQSDKVVSTTTSKTDFPTTFLNNYKYYLNADSTKLLVNYRIVPQYKRDIKSYDKIGLFVFDQHMKKIWGDEFVMPYTEAMMDFVDYTVDNNGDVYMLAKVFDAAYTNSKERTTAHFEIFKFTKDNKTPIIVPVNFGQDVLLSPRFVQNNKNEIFYTTTYSKRNKNRGIAGIYIGKLNKQTLTVENYNGGYYDFPKQELVNAETKAVKNKIDNVDDYEVRSMNIKNIITEDDGSFLFCFEENYTKTTNTTKSIIVDYYCDDIFVVRIDKNGRFHWLKKIQKHQEGAGSYIYGDVGFKLMNDKYGYYFLYMDNSKNQNLGPEDERHLYNTKTKQKQLIVSKIDIDGNLTKEVLFDIGKEDFSINPLHIKKINETEYVGRLWVRPYTYRPVLIKFN